MTTTPANKEGQDPSGDNEAAGLRVTCSQCGHRIDPKDESKLSPFTCHVRAFVHECFHVWRCPGCQTIHCLEVVDLELYYAKYPFADAVLTWPFRLFYRNLTRRLSRFGFNRDSSLLDYGCGKGILVDYLRGHGFAHCHGYDPYAGADGCGNPVVLEQGPFDFVLLQDVLEHVEEPESLLAQMDEYLAPGGHIVVGTPNAENLDLSQPAEFSNEVHVPYHLHIYTRETVEAMGRRRGWEPVGFFDRPYHDLPYFGLNCRATKQYQHLMGGTMDAVLEPVKPLVAITSPKFIFYAIFGYWLSYRSDMTIVFRKDASASRSQ